jgi:hypothetical protein
MASFAQLELVRAIWTEWTGGTGTDAGLATWLETGVQGHVAALSDL